jgi:molybdopterin-containing oxidoreductase family iron-sulfur binding subunit
MDVKKFFFDKLKGSCSSTKSGCDCSSGCGSKKELEPSMQKQSSRRDFLKVAGIGASLTMTGCGPLMGGGSEKKELVALKWEDYFKKNYRLMTTDERQKTVERLEKISELEHKTHFEISNQAPIQKVLFGYAFNISKCQGYMDCIEACVKENNLDRESGMQYIRIFEMKNGNMDLESANSKYHHEVPVEDHFYMGTQCFHCEKPPCTDVCPTGATWKEDDGIVVIDYDWCIGCRYCEAACPYWGRRFNWATPKVPEAEVNPTQHYLGNRLRKKGVMEKCTWCVQRTRNGQMPACVEACPTGARVFGNLLDPNSEIRKIIETKKVFRLKEELGTEPKFWYYMD